MTHMKPVIPLILLIMIGCTSSRPSNITVDNFKDLSLISMESVLDSVWSHIPPDSFMAVGNMAMKSPLYSGPEVRAEILHRRSDSLMMIFSIRGLGFEAGRLLVTQDSIFLYDRVSKQVSVADTSHPVFLPILQVDNAIESLLGYVYPIASDALDLEFASGQMILKNPLLHRSYSVNTDYWRITSVLQHDDSESLVEGLYYNDYFKVGEIYYPRRVVYRNLHTETSIILTYSRITIDEPLKPLNFDLPKDVRRISYSDQY